MKGEGMAKRSSLGLGSVVRKRLSDITNSQSQPEFENTLEVKQQARVPVAIDDVVSQLLKEKATLMKLIEERNKIIEQSGNELRSLRINCQKLQLQNWNLAQSNSQFIAELNVGREKLKTLQHELVLKNALLKAKNSEQELAMKDAFLDKKNVEQEVKADIINFQQTGDQEQKKAEEECLEKKCKETKPPTREQRRNARSRSMGPSITTRQAADKEMAENKRRCLRRQSARFKSQEPEPSENLFEIEDVKLPSKNIVILSAAKASNCDEEKELQQLSHRSSIGRPLRRAAEKVQSYKEVRLNVKMRRVE